MQEDFGYVLAQDQYERVYRPKVDEINKKYNSEKEKLKKAQEEKLKREKYDALMQAELEEAGADYKKEAQKFALLDEAFNHLIRNFYLTNEQVHPLQLLERRRTLGKQASKWLTSEASKDSHKQVLFPELVGMAREFSSEKTLPEKMDPLIRYIDRMSEKYTPSRKVSVFVRPMYGYLKTVHTFATKDFDDNYAVGHASLGIDETKDGKFDEKKNYVSFYPADRRGNIANACGSSSWQNDNGKIFDDPSFGPGTPACWNASPHISDKEPVRKKGDTKGDGMLVKPVSPLSFDLDRDDPEFPLRVNLFFPEEKMQKLRLEIAKYFADMPSYGLLSHLFFPQCLVDRKSHQCASAVEMLLAAAGIYEIFHFTYDSYTSQYAALVRESVDMLSRDVKDPSPSSLWIFGGTASLAGKIPIECVRKEAVSMIGQTYLMSLGAHALFEHLKHEKKIAISPYYVQRLVLAAEEYQLAEFEVLHSIITQLKSPHLDKIRKDYEDKEKAIRSKYRKNIEREVNESLKKEIALFDRGCEAEKQQLEKEFGEYVRSNTYLTPEQQDIFSGKAPIFKASSEDGLLWCGIAAIYNYMGRFDDRVYALIKNQNEGIRPKAEEASNTREGYKK